MKKAAEQAGVEMLLDDPKTKLDAQVKALETYITEGRCNCSFESI